MLKVRFDFIEPVLPPLTCYYKQQILREKESASVQHQ